MRALCGSPVGDERYSAARAWLTARSRREPLLIVASTLEAGGRLDVLAVCRAREPTTTSIGASCTALRVRVKSRVTASPPTTSTGSAAER